MSIEGETYKQEFREYYQAASEKDYGSARLTAPEFTTLKGLYVATIKAVCGTVRVGDLTSADKKIIRQMVTGRIIEQGWPQPEKVDAKDLAESAIAHACVVAENLLEERGVEAAPKTYFSYTTKDQFDRFVATQLIKAGRIKKEGDLYKQWYSSQDRELGYENSKIRYPEGVDGTNIHGVAKPHRFWPAQLLRIIEELRLGGMPEEKRRQLKVGDTDVKRYAIPWRNYEKTILEAESVDDIAVGVAIRTMEILMEKRRLRDEQIIELIVAGYSPEGPIDEHGNIPQVHEIWRKILDRVGETNKISHMGERLKGRVEEAFKEAGYDFKDSAS